jgi:hypothetical protein
MPTPVVSDTLVCLKNDRKRGLLNGSIWHVDKVRPARKGLLRYTLSADEDQRGKGRTVVTVNPAYFDGTSETLTPAEQKRSDAFDFGYAHRPQVTRLAVGRRGPVRRELRFPGERVALALYGHHEGGQAHPHRALRKEPDARLTTTWSPRSPCPGLTSVFAFRRASCDSDRLTSSTS